jgi:hypothetical protein
MKHLKKFESDSYDSTTHYKSGDEILRCDTDRSEEMQKLQNLINVYNKELIDDEIWKEYYHGISDYYTKSRNDKKLLEDIIEFAKSRIEKISEENKNLIEDVQLYLDNYFEDCEDFIKDYTFNTEKLGSGKLLIRVLIEFSRNAMDDRRIEEDLDDRRYAFGENEVLKFWPVITSLMNALRSLGLKTGIIFYQPNGTNMKMYIKNY